MRIATVVLALSLLFPRPAAAVDPANPRTGTDARRVLNYLASLADRRDERLISGQFTNYGSAARLADCELTFQKTGHWPAMIGLDYAEFSTGGLACANVNRLAIAYARQGGLVTISVHLYNPANPQGGGLRDQGVDLETLLTPGSETHRRWMRALDTIALGLRELKDAGVVVLWRPFHEMNGGWFWWGGKDPGAFIRVWRHMFEYFSVTKGLDNLLWVYSPNHGDKVAAYYPGDAYVDIVGLDAYTDFVDPVHIHGYKELLRFPKPFGFTEFGPHGPSDPPGDFDFARFLTGVRDYFPRACFFQAWHGKWGLGANKNAKALFDDSWVIDRDDLRAAMAAHNSK